MTSPQNNKGGSIQKRGGKQNLNKRGGPNQGNRGGN